MEDSKNNQANTKEMEDLIQIYNEYKKYDAALLDMIKNHRDVLTNKQIEEAKKC